ncbi:MAG: recombinase family protein [Chloroflexota bacterium]
MKAAIYCRVSTEDQEREGTSLGSQQDACLKLAKDSGYETCDGYTIREVYSGLTLDRPELLRLRQWIRDREIDTVIAYSTDRVSRDPVHLLLIAEEIEKAGLKLLLVSEPLDNTLEGQLLSYVKGWASKLEVVRTRDRSIRGKKERALSGKLPGNSHARLYGYTYIPGRGVGEGIRYVNELEAEWVRSMFRWVIEEKLSTNAITKRLTALGAPTPSGNKAYWARDTVYRMLRNSAYCGKTYAFTRTYGEPKKRLKPDAKRKNSGVIWKDRSEWVEIPGATPPIISEEVFQAAQKQLEHNKQMALARCRTVNRYLLSSHVNCSRCGKPFSGTVKTMQRGGKTHKYRRYRCRGKSKLVSPVGCDNPAFPAERLEAIVWEQIEAVLSNPDLILAELKRRNHEGNDRSFLKRDLERVKTQLANTRKRKERIWKAFEITGDEETFRKDIRNAEQEIGTLGEEKAKLEKRIDESQQLQLDAQSVREACRLVKQNLGNLTFEDKRLALEALQVKVWIDGSNVTIQGAIPIENGLTLRIAS